MMTNKQIKELVQMLDESALTDLEVHAGEDKLILRKQAVAMVAAPVYTAPAPGPAHPAPVPAAVHVAAEVRSVPSSGPDPKWKAIKSPIVGTFYRAPGPDAPLFVKEGQHVSVGAVVCIVEAMKIMNEIRSELNGTVQKICLENTQPVQFDEVLFWILPD
jgi:acetyl-CoA carboxylase biotin carboxyl carrier protein